MLGWLTGAAVLGGAGAYSYGAMAPQSQLFGASFARGADPQQLALTYDDGPNDSSTLPLLEVLAKYGVKATFFLIGRHVRSRAPDGRTVRVHQRKRSRPGSDCDAMMNVSVIVGFVGGEMVLNS